MESRRKQEGQRCFEESFESSIHLRNVSKCWCKFFQTFPAPVNLSSSTSEVRDGHASTAAAKVQQEFHFEEVGKGAKAIPKKLCLESTCKLTRCSFGRFMPHLFSELFTIKIDNGRILN